MSFPLTLLIDAQMAPLMRLLVYYVREGGETVADSIEVEVAPRIQSKISGYFLVQVQTPLLVAFLL